MSHYFYKPFKATEAHTQDNFIDNKEEAKNEMEKKVPAFISNAILWCVLIRVLI